TSEMSRIQAACQGIRRVPSGGIGECRTSKLNSRILDVVFNEDASRIAMEDAVENMALFRRFVLNIVKQSNCGARSQRNKLKRAGWNDDYRAQLFFG
ncbi:transposase, partial [Aeromonas hydrophila]|uniref:transposase n=1 Tax=Aeromonas hydrophila TaxID=644 RepID=UPI003EC8085E